MKTEELIGLLATGAGPAPRRVVPTRIGVALGIGVLASALASLATLGLNPALPTMGAALAVKIAYVLGVLAAAAWWLARTARPAAPWHRAAGLLAPVVGVMALWSALVIGSAAAEARAPLLLGNSWMSCPWRVAALSLPAWAVAFWALRGLAPTRPRLAGFAAGLFAGANGALGYALFCPELSPAFVVIWYSLGMLIPAAVGAWLGPCLLRW